MQKLEGPILLFVLVAAVTIVLAAQDKPHGGRPLTANLTGAAEVPGPGDADGSGSAKITLNHGKGEICYELKVSNIAPATLAHIHTGGSTVAGPVLVTLDPPADGSSDGCVNVEKDTVKAILDNPAGYYINVHNADFPDGAVRGQLSK